MEKGVIETYVDFIPDYITNNAGWSMFVCTFLAFLAWLIVHGIAFLWNKTWAKRSDVEHIVFIFFVWVVLVLGGTSSAISEILSDMTSEQSDHNGDYIVSVSREQVSQSLTSFARAMCDDEFWGKYITVDNERNKSFIFTNIDDLIHNDEAATHLIVSLMRDCPILRYPPKCVLTLDNGLRSSLADLLKDFAIQANSFHQSCATFFLACKAKQLSELRLRYHSSIARMDAYWLPFVVICVLFVGILIVKRCMDDIETLDVNITLQKYTWK